MQAKRKHDAHVKGWRQEGGKLEFRGDIRQDASKTNVDQNLEYKLTKEGFIDTAFKQ